MSIYHCTIKIINRAGGRSAISSAAYRSGERLLNEETGIVHDFTRKGGVIYSEIMLPANAPPQYSDREILWNDVQRIEHRADAQLAREIEAALPVELSREEQYACIRAFVQKNFIDEGMIADWALHDKGDGNPHVHIMLTVRGLDDNQQWLQKQKTVFANARDENGRAIYNPELPAYDSKNRDATAQYRIPLLDKNGKQKTRVRKGKGTEYLWEKISIPVNDWNEHSKAEIWRASWAEECNNYLSEDKKIDHRSYARQGIDMEPTIHEGVTARKMEKDGKTAERCEMNREVRKRNSLRESAANLTKEIIQFIWEKARELYERIRRIEKTAGPLPETEPDSPDSRVGADGERGTEGTGRRIDEYKQFIDESEQKIAGTDRRIEEINRLIEKEEAELNERLKRLEKRRKNAAASGGNGAGFNRQGQPNSEFETGAGIFSENGLESADDVFQVQGAEGFADAANGLRALFGMLESKERAAEEKRRDSETERRGRETEQLGQRTEDGRAPESRGIGNKRGGKR